MGGHRLGPTRRVRIRYGLVGYTGLQLGDHVGHTGCATGVPRQRVTRRREVGIQQRSQRRRQQHVVVGRQVPRPLGRRTLSTGTTEDLSERGRVDRRPHQVRTRLHDPGDHRRLIRTRDHSTLTVIDNLDTKSLSSDLRTGGTILAVLTRERDHSQLGVTIDNVVGHVLDTVDRLVAVVRVLLEHVLAELRIRPTRIPRQRNGPKFILDQHLSNRRRMRRTSRQRQEHNTLILVAHHLVALQVRRHVIGVVQHNQLHLTPRNATIFVHHVPIRRLRINNLDHQRSKDARQVSNRTNPDHILSHTKVIRNRHIAVAPDTGIDRT
ncbi:MAG: hypothetical protein MAG471_01033 [Acidimicrobiaceae bacterium]|nr:hypothetical protein [Acidimicrobiaceae bacterium]